MKDIKTFIFGSLMDASNFYNDRMAQEKFECIMIYPFPDIEPDRIFATRYSFDDFGVTKTKIFEIDIPVEIKTKEDIIKMIENRNFW